MPAILTVAYTPNYNGNHRICFRTLQSAYCCYNDDSTSVIGVQKFVNIDLEDFELCLQSLPVPIGCSGFVVEGYVQPICIEQGSDVNRVAFTATFPSTPCTPYQILCTETGIATVEITNSGSGYIYGETPAVTVIDTSGGYGAVIETTMDCPSGSGPCSLQELTITYPGANYLNINTISIIIDPPRTIADTGIGYADNLNNIFYVNGDKSSWTGNYVKCVNGNGDVLGTFLIADAVYDSLSLVTAVTCPSYTILVYDGGMSYYLYQDVPGGVQAEAIVTALDDCGTFTVPNCDGTANPTTYSIWGGQQHAINVCAGGAGPDAFKYTVTSNPTYTAEGRELVVNGSFTNDLSGWTYFPDDPNTPSNVFWTSQGVTWDPSDVSSGLTQDILTVGKYYVIDITLTCDYGPFFPFPIPQNQVAFELSFGTNTLAPIVFSGIQQSYQFNYVSCLGNPTFRIVALNGYAPSNQVAEMSCSYVSIREMDVSYPVSCCDCVKYDVVNNCYLDKDIDIYYTDCNQIIQTLTVGATPTTICSVRGSAWPVNKDDNPCIEITLSATQDC